jgi:hypothetical protein
MANVIQLGENESVRALQRMLTLKNQGLMPAEIRKKMGNAQYNLAENELILRSGDPNRYDPKTGGWKIWP